jgi:hypothetical protein
MRTDELYMKRLLIFISLLVISTFSFSQQDTVIIKQTQRSTDSVFTFNTDTVILPHSEFKRQILAGTCVLPWTVNQQYAKGHGIFFEKVLKSDCKNHGEEVYNSDAKINSITSTDTSLIIDINIYENCCHDFLCDISIDSTSTLNLVYYAYGSTYCACDCCFGLTYYFSKTKYGPDNKTIKAVIINDNKKTIKYLKN